MDTKKPREKTGDGRIKKLKKRSHRKSNSSKSNSYEHDDTTSPSHGDSLNNMDESNKKDDEQTSISENISASATSESCEITPQFFDNIDKDNKPSGSKFEIDDLQLSGDNIAQHFKPITEPDHQSEKNNLPISFLNKRKLLQQNNDVDSLDQILNEIDSEKEGSVSLRKELSPLNEDVVLINDSKVSLNSLKKLQKQSNVGEQDNSLSTTHDISDLARDTLTESERNSDFQEPQSEKVETLKFEEQHETSVEEDHSIEEFLVSDNSVEVSLEANNLSSLDPNINIDDESAMNKLLGVEEEDISHLREKILNSSKSFEELKSQVDEDQHENQRSENDLLTKQMEKVTEFKEALEDISEESEHTLSTSNKMSDKTSETSRSLTMEKGKEIRKILEEKIMNLNIPEGDDDDNKENIPELNSLNRPGSFEYDSVVSVKMFQTMESKVKELQEVIVGKDACLAELNMQVDNYSRQSSLKEGRDSLKEMLKTSTEGNSIATNSTEYRTIQDEMVLGKIQEFQLEIQERDQWIEQLSTSLQLSIQVRDELQKKGDKLATEVLDLKKQLAESVETIKNPHWMRDQESTGQRISEFSLDLVSETEDTESDRNFPDMYDERSNRNSRERQLDNFDLEIYDQNPLLPPPISSLTKEIEQFQKFLNPAEIRLFNMVQHKFDDFLKQEIEKVRVEQENQAKVLVDTIESEKNEQDIEITRLRDLLSSMKCGSTELNELRQELEKKHTQEMADLRTYFEKKCAELEKQYSEEVFSQSRRQSNDTSPDLSDQEYFPEENGGYHSKQGSPKRKHKEDIYASPTHRKITPTNIDGDESNKEDSEFLTKGENDPEPTIDELKQFYHDKISEINHQHKETTYHLRERLKRFEAKYADEEFMSTENNKPVKETLTQSHSLPPQILTNINNEHNDLHEIIAEYERRLQEQVALAREDVLRELEIQIQALLSETSTEDRHWPPELILLREKFTAKSQLEIAQIQIKHEEEMARMKTDFEKQLQRKIKRHTTFDSVRDLDKIITERDSLRELSSTLRCVLGELAKYFSICEDDLNNTVIDELQKHGILTSNNETLDVTNPDLNLSGISDYSQKKYLKFTPDVSGIISIIEDPSFLEFISKNRDSTTNDLQLNLDDCLEKLNLEALNILGLSERLCKKQAGDDIDSEKGDSCEEEDGLKRGGGKTKSFDENILQTNNKNEAMNNTNSLPIDLGTVLSKGELNVQLHELRNRLLKSEDERCKLESELVGALSKKDSLVMELNETKLQLTELGAQREVFSEGYGTNATLQESKARNLSSFVDLQEKAKHLLSSTTPNNTIENNVMLMQLVEDFCREGEQYIEDGKRDKNDLQSQPIKNTTNSLSSNSCNKIEAADKQLKATRQFLEDQAAEREQERDDFTKEIEKLKAQLREKDKDKTNFDRVTKEEGFLCENCCSSENRDKHKFQKMEVMEQHVKELNAQMTENEQKKLKLESDFKETIDKVFTLREIIVELETQIESKTINEQIMNTKVKELELYIDAQTRQTESLQHEVESLKTDVIVRGYDEKISSLEEQLKHSRPSDEQSQILEQITDQLRDIEDAIDRKTKALESLHASTCATASCSSPSEDVSVNQDSPIHKAKNSSSPKDASSIPVDEVQRIKEKLCKHSRVEEAAIKRINDLEMQVTGVRTGYMELQHERDALQDRMTEQSLKISSLQSKLDEQRLRAEDLHRQGTSHLTIKVHDLQNDLVNLKETLQSRDKQIVSLKSFLENSKQVIERQENELAMNQEGNNRSQYEMNLENELKQKSDEVQILKDKIKNEMINKLALPDLMETMLADKNEEIDQLKEKLKLKEDDNARTLSDIVSISEYDEPDMVMRKMSEQQNEGYLFPPNSLPMDSSSSLFQNSSKEGSSNKPKLADSLFGPRQSPFLGSFEKPSYFQDISTYPKEGGSFTPEGMAPRQINFSMIESSNSAERNNMLKIPAFIEEIREDENKKLSDIDEEEAADENKLELESLKLNLDRITNEKNQMKDELKEKVDIISDLQVELAARNKLYSDMMDEKKELQKELDEVKKTVLKLEIVEADLDKREAELKEAVHSFNKKEEELRESVALVNKLQDELDESIKENSLLKIKVNDTKFLTQIDTLKQQVESLHKTINHKDELLTKMEKDLLNYTKNEQKYLDEIKSLEGKECDLKILQGKYKDKEHETEILNEDNRFLNEEINRLKNDIVRSNSSNSNNSYCQFLKQNCDKLEEELQETKCYLTKKMLSLEKAKIDLTTCEKDIELLRVQLKDKNSFIQQIGDDGNSLHVALSSIQNKMQENNRKLKEEQEKNQALEAEINGLKIMLQRSDNSSSPKPFSVEEIAEQIEKELNYSAQLDSSILKAIESDEINSDEEENESKKAKTQKKAEELENKLVELKALLEEEKRNSNSIQLQDADLIEKLRLRLESAIDNETMLQKMLDDERNKNERLSNLVSGVQRTKSFDNYLLMKPRSPIDSPRRLNRSNDFESEIVNRLESEIKLLTSQNERERERAMDLQKSLDRERNRFEKEISDRNEHMEKIKRELNRICQEKENCEMELDHEQEKLILAHKEIDSLEKRISSLQEAESRRAARRSSGDSEVVQELKQERIKLQETINILRDDIDRGARREVRLAEALSKENSFIENGGANNTVPEEFLIKLKEMNKLLESNSRENRQLAETLHLLTEERRALQLRNAELERNQNGHYNRDDLEERSNHLFGKYLRLESHRKALVHQKRYLLIVLATYEDNEKKALAMLQANKPNNINNPPIKKPTKSFRSVAICVIAIERMKYIVKRWHCGKRVGAKAIFSQQFGPKRSQSATTNVWTRSPNSHFVEYNSPPSRERNQVNHFSSHYLRPLEAPHILNSDLREKLEEQYNQLNHNDSR